MLRFETHLGGNGRVVEGLLDGPATAAGGTAPGSTHDACRGWVTAPVVYSGV